MEYIEKVSEPGCFLCDYRDSSDDQANRVLSRKGTGLLLLNAYPYNSGHLLAATIRHVSSIEDLSDEESRDVMRLVADGVSALRQALAPEGFNLGANLGVAAGAGLPGHFHMHIVPRWTGDTNFMPVVGDSKVLPETLAVTYTRLRDLLG